jgi:hypothetical protein
LGINTLGWSDPTSQRASIFPFIPSQGRLTILFDKVAGEGKHAFSNSAGCEMQRGRLLFSRLPINSMIGMTKRVRDFFFVLPIDEYRLLKECLPRHSVGYNALDLDVPAGEGKRAFTCSENELRDIIQSVVQKFPIGKALATLIRQQWQPRSKAQSKKPKKPRKVKKP